MRLSVQNSLDTCITNPSKNFEPKKKKKKKNLFNFKNLIIFKREQIPDVIYYFANELLTQIAHRPLKNMWRVKSWVQDQQGK